MRHLRSAQALVLAALALGVWPALHAAAKPGFKIEPGPAAITEEEAAIAADPAAGAEHGVILLEEADYDDSTTLSKTTFHRRAKILSNEGRDLANVEILILDKTGSVKEWWGRVLLPDGTMLDVPRSLLQEQPLVRYGRREWRALKAALPGVVPGCVIDYGYVVWDDAKFWVRHEPLQRSWPVRRIRLRWNPMPEPTAFTITRAGDLAIQAAQEGRAFVVTGTNLPTVVEEPFMPPPSESLAAAWFYYTGFNASGSQNYWDELAKAVESRLKEFTRSRSPLDEALGAMRIPPGADLQAKLQAAYDWLRANVREASAKPLEEIESELYGRASAGVSAGQVLKAGSGTGVQIDLLYAGLARALGAEAGLVLATDRTDHYWHSNVLSPWLFDVTLVAVRAPGEPLQSATLVDPSYGLRYGQVPWWVAGSKGLLATEKGAQEIDIKPSGAADDLSVTRVSVAFDEAVGGAGVRWSRTSSGQHGVAETRRLRALSAEDRRKRLESICGASADFELSRAEAPKLDDRSAELQIECEGLVSDAGADQDLAEFAFPVQGPWIQPVPELSASRRTHPVQFEYPRIDRASIEVAAPPGFAPGPSPEPVAIEVPFGAYTLSAEAAGTGFVVTREFKLALVSIRPEASAGLRKFLADVRVADSRPLRFRRAEAPAP